MARSMGGGEPVLVTGAAGQLGREFCRQLGAAAIPIDRQICDLTDRAQVTRLIRDYQPAAIINSAAYTQVDRAEADRDRCFAVNAVAVEWLAEWAEARRIPFVQISTDYLFGGSAGVRLPHAEDESVEPRGVYAESKYAGETAAARCTQHLIVRTCGLYSRPEGDPVRGRNFVDTMRVLGRERPVIKVVDDQYCTPTYVPDLARAILYLLGQRQVGLFHVVNGGAVTWYEFAREIFRLEGREVELIPITTAQYGAAAPRPAYSVLSTAKYESVGGVPLRSWQAALADYFGC